MEPHLKPAWLEINLSALLENFKAIQSFLPSTKIIPVLKSDAYGMGCIEIAEALHQVGVDFFAVGNVAEALKLEGLGGKILLLHPPFPEEIPLIVEKKIVQAVSTFETAKLLSEEGVRQQKQVKVHLKLNVGLNRLGFKPSEILRDIPAISALPSLCITGIFAHFSFADNFESPVTLNEAALFEETVQTLRKIGITVPFRHLCNSAGILNFPQFAFEGVRPGILLYGVKPALATKHEIPLKSVVSLKSRVIHVLQVKKGEAVSYGGKWKAPEDGNLATISAGYADGISLSLSNRGEVLIRGERFPIVGQVCMDLTVVSLGKKNVSVGDEVVFLGKQGNEEIGVLDWVLWGNLEPHEVLTGIGKKLPKKYLAYFSNERHSPKLVYPRHRDK
jgi:alanine racemase